MYRLKIQLEIRNCVTFLFTEKKESIVIKSIILNAASVILTFLINCCSIC